MRPSPAGRCECTTGGGPRRIPRDGSSGVNSRFPSVLEPELHSLGWFVFQSGSFRRNGGGRICQVPGFVEAGLSGAGGFWL